MKLILTKKCCGSEIGKNKIKAKRFIRDKDGVLYDKGTIYHEFYNNPKPVSI